MIGARIRATAGRGAGLDRRAEYDRKQAVYTLLVTKGPDAGLRFPIYGTRVSVGRAPDMMLVLTDPSVHLRHLMVIFDDGGWKAITYDADATVLVDRRWQHPSTRQRGARIFVGGTQLLLFAGDIDIETARSALDGLDVDEETLRDEALTTVGHEAFAFRHDMQGKATRVRDEHGRPVGLDSASSSEPDALPRPDSSPDPGPAGAAQRAMMDAASAPTIAIDLPGRGGGVARLIAGGALVADLGGWASSAGPGLAEPVTPVAMTPPSPRAPTHEVERAAPPESAAASDSTVPADDGGETTLPPPGVAGYPGAPPQPASSGPDEVFRAALVAEALTTPEVPIGAPTLRDPPRVSAPLVAPPIPALPKPTALAVQPSTPAPRPFPSNPPPSEPAEGRKNAWNAALVPSQSAPAPAPRPATTRGLEIRLNDTAIAALPSRSRDLEVLYRKDGPFAGELRILSTRMEELRASFGYRSFLFTSAAAGEGKTVTVANLALVMSEDPSRRVALVDANFRAPRQAELFNLDASRGILSALAGKRSLGECVARVVGRNLIVLSAGGELSNPSAVLTDPKFRTLLDELSQAVDFLLVDAPAALPHSDVPMLMTHTDAAFVVVAGDRTRRGDLAKALEAVGSKRVVGAVFRQGS